MTFPLKASVRRLLSFTDADHFAVPVDTARVMLGS